MNPRIIKLGVESGMLNYVDHETPRHYFLSAHADEECLERFAELIVQECISQIEAQCFPTHSNEWIQKAAWNAYICAAIKHHFGDES
jgi:hypothetical protein